MGVFGHEKAPHIAQHHQDVLVHRVGMEQVMLHLAHDAPEHPQVAPKHRGFVHQAHRMGDALGLLQDLQKRLAVDWIGTKAPVHDRPNVVQSPQRSGRQTFEARRGLVKQKGLQYCVRVLLVQIVAGHLNQSGFFKKAGVQGPEVVNALTPLGFEAVLDVEQQNLVELRHGLGRPIVLAHQFFTGTQGQTPLGRDVGGITKGLGHIGLQVKHQAVFAPLGLQVQTGADQAQQGFIAFDLPGLQRCGQPFAGEFVPTVAQARGAGDPQNHLQVTQAARRFFAVGLQGVRGVVKLGVALVHFQRFGHQKCLRVHRRLELLLKFKKQFGVACDPTRLEQRGLYGDVFGRFGQALVQAAHAGAYFEPGVPAVANETFELGLQGRVTFRRLAGGQQHQHIHIGVGEQFGATKPPHSDQ